MTMPTLLDIAKRNGSDAVTGLIDEASRVHPEITLGYARTIKGLNYKTLVRTAVPHGGSFRSANAGVAASKSTTENRLVETFILNPRWECDKAVADRAEDGREAYIAQEGGATLEGALQDLAAQFYYGVGAGGNAAGFPGLIDAYDATNMLIDAGGGAATTGSSVWAVRFGPKNVAWVYGNGGELTLSDVREESIRAADLTAFTAYVQELLAYPGVQVGSTFSVARIRKLTAEVGHMLTDALIANMLALFPAGIQPDVMFMSRRSRGQLQASRTAINATGAPAPMPEEAFGIKIAVTDAILNTEALTL